MSTNRPKLNWNFIRRQLTSTKRQAVVFVLCVALSMVTLVALGGFRASVNQALDRDARTLQAADIIINSRNEFPPTLLETVDALETDGQVETVRLYEFYSIVRVTEEDNSALADLKIAGEGYPFYGTVELASGRDFQTVLEPGQTVVEQGLLERLNLSVGDPLRVGQTTLTIADVVVSEPDRPVTVFGFGPRVFVDLADLEATDLVKVGSRVTHRLLLKVNDESQLNSLTAQLRDLRSADPNNRFRVENFRTAESGVQVFLENFIFFLSLVGIFTLLLAGIGIQSSLTAFLKERERTIAIIKTLGASSQFVRWHFFTVVLLLGGVGTAVGLVLGLGLQFALPTLFTGLLPPDVDLIISPLAILEGAGLGLIVVLCFTFLPLYNLKDLKPSFIFRREYLRLERGWPYYATLGLILAFFVGMVLWQLQDVEVGLYFVGGVLALVALAAGITEVALRIVRRITPKDLAARQALRGLFRPRNATRAIIITLCASLAVLFCIYLIEQNLNANFVRSYPDDAPNVFFIDLQADQVDGFRELVDEELTLFPVVRGNVTAINGETIDYEAERERESEDNLARTFNLTYGDSLPENEAFVSGDSLFREDWEGPQVSVWDFAFQLYPFEVGDTIEFDIQGIPITAQVSSIRTRPEEQPQPAFYFILEPEVLADAPQSIFTAGRFAPADIPRLQNEVVAAYPNVTVIDVTAAIASLSSVIRRLSQVIRFFTVFSMIAGLLIIVSSIFATRFARVQEAVYFKVLGAKGRFVLRVFTLENVFLGLLSAGLALLLAQIGSWILIELVFELDYRPFFTASGLLVVMTTVLVTAVGLLASVSILRQRPIVFLREQTGEE